MQTLNRRAFLGRSSAAAALVFGSSFEKLHAAKSEPAESIVATANGKIRGTIQEKVHAFKGVSYGASTAGEGRFLPPEKPQSWTGVRDALELGPASPQIPSRLIPESMAQQPAWMRMAPKIACT